MLTGSCLCGDVRWRHDAAPASATACNCTACRRYGALWIYGWEGHGTDVAGATQAYGRPNPDLNFQHCPRCGCIVSWRGVTPHPDGRTRMAVNLRLADDPAAVQGIPVRHFDGFDSFTERPADGRCVRDYWI